MSVKMIDHMVDQHTIDIDPELLKRVKVTLQWTIKWICVLFFLHDFQIRNSLMCEKWQFLLTYHMTEKFLGTLMQSIPLEFGLY